LEGETVVDLWGGRTTRDGADWERDTLCTVFSSTKGAMSLCAHLLADRGELDLDAPVAEYWPEFACGGKESATVKMTLDHSVGVPHVRDEVKAGGFYDYDCVVERIGRWTCILGSGQPWWLPRHQHGVDGWRTGAPCGRETHGAIL